MLCVPSGVCYVRFFMCCVRRGVLYNGMLWYVVVCCGVQYCTVGIIMMERECFCFSGVRQSGMFVMQFSSVQLCSAHCSMVWQIRVQVFVESEFEEKGNQQCRAMIKTPSGTYRYVPCESSPMCTLGQELFPQIPVGWFAL